MDDVATCIYQLQAQENSLERQGKYTFKGKNSACIVEHWAYIPVIHRTVLKNVGPLLKKRKGQDVNRKRSQ